MQCPFCKEEIQEGAIKCKHCGSILDNSESTSPVATASKINLKETRMRNIKFCLVVTLSILGFMFGILSQLVWADDFSFLDIKWTDTPQIVANKVEKSGIFDKAAESKVRPIEISEVADEDDELTKTCKAEFIEIAKETSQGWKQMEQYFITEYVFYAGSGNKNFVKLFEIVYFYFSNTTKKLLYYKIQIDPYKTEQVSKMLADKYGHGQPGKGGDEKWSGDGQELYYNGAQYVTYYSTKNLKEHCAIIQKKQAEIDKEQKDKFKKAF